MWLVMAMAWDWVDKLLGIPITFRDGWLEAANGGLWKLCREVAKGKTDAKEKLCQLAEVLETARERLQERLEWFLKEEGLPSHLANTLLTEMQQLTNAFLHRNDEEFSDYLKEFKRQIALQGLGVHQNHGFVVRVILEEWEPKGSDLLFLPHPESRLLPQDYEFQGALEIVKQWWKTSGVSSQPAHITWRISRIDNQPLAALKGDSLSALFAVGIWLLCSDIPVDQTITISAAINPDGQLRPVGGIEKKAWQHENTKPRLRYLLIAANQQVSGRENFPPDFFQPVRTVAEAKEFFITHAKPFQTVREHTRQQTEHFRFFDRTFDWDTYEEPIVREGNERVELWAWFKKHLQSEQGVRFLLTASSGMGKTTALRFLAHRLCTDPIGSQFVPILVTASQWSDIFFKFHKSLPAILEHLFGSSPKSDHWCSWLSHGRVVLLVDQAEQVDHLCDFRDHLSTVLKEFNRLHLLIAVRSEWLERFSDLNLPSVHLEPLSEPKARRLCEKLARFREKLASVELPSSPPLPLLGGSPLLLIAAFFCSRENALGQGQLVVRLAEWLLSHCSDLPLPSNRVLKVLTEAVWMLPPDKTVWCQGKFYDALQQVAEEQHIVGELWSKLWMGLQKCPLLSFYDTAVSFSHTLLSEALQALAIANRCTNGTLPSDIHRRLAPLRTILLASLLPDRAAPAFWEWLQRRMESEPVQWAEVAARCLHERTDAPERFITTLLSRWFTAFTRGAHEKEGWDQAISALPPFALQQFALPKVEQWLTTANFADDRAAVHLLALIADKIDFSDTLLHRLLKAFLANRYRITLLPDLKTLLESEKQKGFATQFFHQLLTHLEDASLTTRRSAAEALAQLVSHPVEVPCALRDEVAEALRRCSQDPSLSTLHPVLRRALAQLHSLGS